MKQTTAMATIESTPREVKHPVEKVYGVLSDLGNIEKVKEKLPEEAAKTLSFTRDTVSVEAPMVGQVSLRVAERREPGLVVLKAENSPIPTTMSVSMDPMPGGGCKLVVAIDAQLNVFVRSMVEKPLREGVEKIADALQTIDYTALCGGTDANE